jgi:nicotinate-nucleotide pyrophosphorylase (carboxylating)
VNSAVIPSPDAATLANADALIALALDEDLGSPRGGSSWDDITTAALIPVSATGAVNLVARSPGVIAGLFLPERIFRELGGRVHTSLFRQDGDVLQAGDLIAEFRGPVRDLLAGERTVLNSLSHLSGVATLTRRFVDRVTGASARIHDTRKTLPGWRRLEKYAVLAGGGKNHRLGLHDMVLIKDNHLAAWTKAGRGDIADAIRAARAAVPAGIRVEVEVDTLDQMRSAIAGRPDIILLDNFSVDDLRTAVGVRDRTAPEIQLEASGGVTLATVREIAETGVDRISTGAVTHSAAALDLAFDWPED